MVRSSDSSFRAAARGQGGVPCAALACTAAGEAMAACSATSGLPSGAASVPRLAAPAHASVLSEIHLATTFSPGLGLPSDRGKALLRYGTPSYAAATAPSGVEQRRFKCQAKPWRHSAPFRDNAAAG